MATIGQMLFYSMLILIVVFAALIILILALTFSKSTSKVTSSNTKPVANLGEDELLSCFVSSQSQQTRLGDVSVTWEKKDLGLVYQYSNGAPALAGQASQFTGRAQVFPVAVATGNASLLLRNVRGGDEGEYTCSVSSSAARGSIIIQLRTAAFSAPTFKFSNGTLTGEASRWFPKPSVTWLNQTGDILSANTSFTENSEGIVGVVSVFESAQVSETYSCRIQNSLVLAETETRVTGTDVSASTYFIFSSAAIPVGSNYVNVLISFLSVCYGF
ncbi:V-set domain-containing T-cell activation inhibitor 1-like [Nothobranchius furzeri]|uniref:V-set domain-containing T-cell activation inhibitor 1-like n=2 Tax=Nothobranchius furzeri TaxID=105023 RepID=A0A9D2Y8H3_NOTFU|nr:V-set domain-containing T-cell activation inhibitor 1-like [Nothobranchius furzeri]